MGPYPHLERADLLVVAPCTANTLAKLALGLADTVLTEAALAHRGPTIVAPAMNPRMWTHAATRANAELLRGRGVELVGPDEGDTAEGEHGVGRMAEPEEIYRRCEELLGSDGDLRGRRVLVTAGGTREPLDSVRFLGNRSSGRMGVALAEEARSRGADVTLLAANLAVSPPGGVEVVRRRRPTRWRTRRSRAPTAPISSSWPRRSPTTASPAPRPDKRPKDDAAWQVELTPTVDIVGTLGRAARQRSRPRRLRRRPRRGRPRRKRGMLTSKNVDLVVYNDVGKTTSASTPRQRGRARRT